MKSLNICQSRSFLYCSFAMFLLTLQACVVSGGNNTTPNNMLAANGTMTQTAIDPILQADQNFVQAILSTSQVHLNADGQLPWDNTTTGSQGIVINFVENQVDGIICRNFQSERTAFNGVGLYDGQICQAASGQWQMTRFQLVQ